MKARLLLACPVLVLAGCDADHTAARGLLTERGYTHLDLRAAPLMDRPCDWSEPFAVAYTGNRDDMRVTGTLCSSDEPLQSGRLLGERRVAPAPTWDTFGSAR